MGCIMTPIPNHLSTHLSLFTTHLLMSGGGVKNTTTKIKKPHKTVWKRRAERYGKGRSVGMVRVSG